MKIDKKLLKIIKEFNNSSKPRISLLFWKPVKGTKGIVNTSKHQIHINRTGDYYSLSWVEVNAEGVNTSYEANFNLNSDDIHIVRIISHANIPGAKNVEIIESSEVNDSQESLQAQLIDLLVL